MKNPYILALISGLLLAASWPTYGISLIVFIAFVPLLLAEYSIRKSEAKKTNRRVWLVGYTTFFVWNLLTTWWIYNSTGFGMLFAVLVNSLLMSIVFLLYHLVAKKFPPKIHYVFLPAIWMAFEKFHLNWDFSWPWLNLGNVFATSTHYIQWYEYTGSFGGSLWVWILNLGFFNLVLKYIATKSLKSVQKRLVFNLLWIAIPIVISLLIKSNYEESGKEIEAVILQPNIDPYTDKYYTTNKKVAQILMDMAAEKADENTEIILAPETVFAKSFRINDFSEDYTMYRLRTFLKRYPKANLLAGTSFIDVFHDPKEITSQSNQYNENTWYNDYNSAFFLNATTDSIPVYHKSKLVVGVENFPFKSVLEPLLGNVMLDLGGTVATKTTQEDRTVFSADDYKVAPVICYESVYGEFVSKYIQNGAEFIAIITNDAWWGNTQGHKQHLNYARLRAIENRKSVVRSANTGISAIINQTGDIQQTLEYGVQGSLKGKIHLNNKVTFYARYGDYIARVAVLASALILLFAFTRKRKL
ncbi:apolipoprotein N-acyltransferase [Pustulibacterium marinum]|uniref:Apolipoprotein N-acyltransferase n=1 Tax=Pustulibacterium marinum TaxID=1224947 RepID=A0A1I7HN63_9FLAO|nr:apolipoprotein N-acyltransferase [Pustulibacterium marinum]SFU62180.1 apolipoprotein N-acyltransferase [Pustulibacterium marinum]